MEIRFVKGIGPVKALALSKLNIHTTADILTFYPRSYEDRTKISTLKDAEIGENLCFELTVATSPRSNLLVGGKNLVSFTAVDETSSIQVAFFNNKYIINKLEVGNTYIFFGKISLSGTKRQLVNPIFDNLDAKGNQTMKIEPIYPLTSGITSKDIKKVVTSALACEQMPQEYLSPKVLSKYDLISFDKAVFQIHNPDSMENALIARKRIIFDELLLLSCALTGLRDRRQDLQGIKFDNLDLSAFFSALPFSPTNAQMRVIEEIISDIRDRKMMSRIVQGDVGSGKTAVAAALCVLACQNGFQSAVMAPTEILASQHVETLSQMLKDFNINIVLLTGNMSAKAKRQVLAQIEDGTAQIIVGTHALISDNVNFHNLACVIADEQHRFGVNARAKLANKANSPHVLVMSATPIPRSLALIIYGDLDLSVIDEMPKGRKPIETYAVGKKMHDRIYAFIDKLVSQGRQAYIVCPMIAENAEYDDTLYDVEGYLNDLSQGVFKHLSVAALHGKTHKTEKARIMSEFANGNIDVLIATTVIEVGINVPNAAIMVIEDGHRFGLSQLHQLRGRVGRGEYSSYCVVFGADKGEKARDRLKIFSETNDGFKIASEDLKIRGPGDFFGTRQHGLPTLKMADLTEDMEILYKAQALAKHILEKDPTLEKHTELRARVHKMLNGDNQNTFN